MLTRLLVTGVALAAAAVHLIWPHLKLDGIVVALLVVALLPWLGAVFESLELPGGWKVKYREIQRQLDETQAKTQKATGAAASASQKAELALATNEPEKADQLNELISEYNKVRASQPSSDLRTTILTQIVGRMVALSPRLTNYNWRNALRSDDQGQRIAGYAWLYSKPDPAAAELLVQTLTTHEDANFGQYWAIQALQRSLPLVDTNTVATLTPKLREFLSNLPSDSGRYYDLSNLLNQLAGLPQH
jgi:hypothetical protein